MYKTSSSSYTNLTFPSLGLGRLCRLERNYWQDSHRPAHRRQSGEEGPAAQWFAGGNHAGLQRAASDPSPFRCPAPRRGGWGVGETPRAASRLRRGWCWREARPVCPCPPPLCDSGSPRAAWGYPPPTPFVPAAAADRRQRLPASPNPSVASQAPIGLSPVKSVCLFPLFLIPGVASAFLVGPPRTVQV